MMVSILADGRLFWFKDQTIEDIINAEEPGSNHLYWTGIIDVDVTIGFHE